MKNEEQEIDDDEGFFLELENLVNETKNDLEKTNNADLFESMYFRSNAMKNKLAGHAFFDIINNTININENTHKVIDSSVNHFAFNHHQDLPLISCGSSSSREMIVLNFKESPLLRKKYREFEALLNNKQNRAKKLITPMQLLIFTNCFIPQAVFLKQKNNQQLVEDFIAKCSQQSDRMRVDTNPIIAIDEFIHARLGVCRHHALIAVFLMDRYLQLNPDKCSFKGKLQIMRSNVKSGAHSWVTLVTGNGQHYCLDTLNNVLGNLSDPTLQERIKTSFGQKAFDNQIKKAQRLEDNHKAYLNNKT